MSYFTKSQIEKIVSCAFMAGEIAENFQKFGDFLIMKKPDGSSVTTADIAVSEFINQKLSEEFPEIMIICEEGKIRDSVNLFWLIDPIDGTDSFMKGNSQFAINIALIKDKKPVFGLIYAPSFEGGKMIFSDHENNIVLENKLRQRKILKAQKFEKDKLRIITSIRTKDVDIDNYISQFYSDFANNIVVEKLSSAVKFFRILENDADLYLHFRPSKEWDIAAGQALIVLMEGKVKKLISNGNSFVIGEDMDYQKPDFYNQSFVSFVKSIF
jgi:3'(2'), 5'-bisphosphate nucleotidase